MFAEIHVTLKPALLDAQGKTVLRALQQLGHRQVRDVRIGKHISIEMAEGQTPSQLEADIDLMCRQLLANPVIEDYSITVGGEVVAASTRKDDGAPKIVTSEADAVPAPRPQGSSAAATPDAQPARLDAPRLSAPQTIVPAATAPHLKAPQSNSATPSMLPESAPGATPVPRESFPDVAVADNAANDNDEAAIEEPRL